MSWATCTLSCPGLKICPPPLPTTRKSISLLYCTQQEGSFHKTPWGGVGGGGEGDQKQTNKSYIDLTAVEVLYSQVSSFRNEAFVGSSRVCVNTMEGNYIKTVRQANKSYSILVEANASRKNCLLLNENRLKLSLGIPGFSLFAPSAHSSAVSSISQAPFSAKLAYVKASHGWKWE